MTRITRPRALALLLPAASFLVMAFVPARAQQVAAPSAGDKPYLVSAADQLDISVQGHDEMHRVVQVLSDGRFNYPIVGTVSAAGMTPDALAAVIAKGISGICNQPVVTVAVLVSHVPKISVMGGVRSAGQLDYHPGMRVLDALAASGGLLLTPEQTGAILVSADGSRSTTIDLTALLTDGNVAQNAMLAPGDVLLLQQRDPSQFTVQVLGQVAKPGAFPVPPGGSTVLAMLTLAGGAAPDAALTQVQVMHAGHAQTVNLHELENNLNSPAGSLTLVAGDTVLVPQNKATVAVLGEVKTPSLYPIPDGEGMNVSTALAQAGGVTNDGDQKQVTILRRVPGSKRTPITVDISQIAKADSDSADTALQPGDILVVPTRRKGHSFGESIGPISGLTLALHYLGL